MLTHILEFSKETEAKIVDYLTSLLKLNLYKQEGSVCQLSINGLI